MAMPFPLRERTGPSTSTVEAGDQRRVGALEKDHQVVVEAVAVDFDATLNIRAQSSPVTIDSTAAVIRSWACLRTSVGFGIACLLRSAAFRCRTSAG
jgi:hypothetical protein